MTDETRPLGVVGRDLPGVLIDNTQQPHRIGRRGEQYVLDHTGSKLVNLADEGAYFLATNPTMGTGIAGIAAATAYDATESLLFLRNTSSTKRLYLDFIELVVTAAGATGTTTGFTLTSDKGNTRYSSGGSAITPVNPNLASSETASVTLYFGAVVTAAASSSARLLGNIPARSVIKVVGDHYRFQFGDSNAAWGCAGASLDGTTSAAITIPCPPVILGENDQFLLHDWAASQSGASSYELRMGFWMR